MLGLIHFASPVQRIYIPLGSLEQRLLIINIFLDSHHGSIQVTSGLLHLELRLLLADSASLKSPVVPLFKLDQQSFLQNVDLSVGIVRILFVLLQISEKVTVMFFAIFLLAEHHELLFVDDVVHVFSTELIVGTHLVLHVALAPFVLLTIELHLDLVNLLL